MIRPESKKSLLAIFAAAALALGGVFYAESALAGYGGGPYASEDSGGKVVIHSPKDGAVIEGSNVVVSYEIVDKGEEGDHVHIYMDGKLVKPVRGIKRSYTIKWVKKGEHTIEVKLATSRHRILEPKAVIKITVK